MKYTITNRKIKPFCLIFHYFWYFRTRIKYQIEQKLCFEFFVWVLSTISTSKRGLWQHPTCPNHYFSSPSSTTIPHPTGNDP